MMCVPHDSPTMWLNLHSPVGEAGDCYKKHTVVHEFGHALGLCHEHQRSNFWKLVESYIDLEKMKKELGLSETCFSLNWESDRFASGAITEYDSKSIMHSW